MVPRKLFSLTVLAGLAVGAARGLDAYLAQGPQLEPASFSDEQRDIIKFVAKRYDVIGFGALGHEYSTYDYLFSDTATLSDFNKLGAANLFLEQSRTDQSWLDAVKTSSGSDAEYQQDCMQHGLNSWFSRAQNEELCRRTIISVRASGLNIFAASARTITLSYTLPARIVGNALSFVTQGLFPNVAPGALTAEPKLLMDRLVGGQIGTYYLDDRDTAAFIAARTKPSEVSIVAYGSDHFSGAAKNNGGIDMVSGLRAQGLKTIVININNSGTQRGDYFQRHSAMPQFTPPDIDFFPATRKQSASVVFNNAALARDYESSKAISSPRP